MEAKDLIKVLQGLDPESRVTLSLGRDDEYRTKCAKAELATGDCLAFLAIDRIEFYPEEGGAEMWAVIVLEQINLVDFEEEAGEFDKMYTKKDED